jgi:hypothetical protein
MVSQANNRMIYLHVVHFRFMSNVADKLGPLVASQSTVDSRFPYYFDPRLRIKNERT